MNMWLLSKIYWKMRKLFGKNNKGLVIFRGPQLLTYGPDPSPGLGPVLPHPVRRVGVRYLHHTDFRLDSSIIRVLNSYFFTIQPISASTAVFVWHIENHRDRSMYLTSLKGVQVVHTQFFLGIPSPFSPQTTFKGPNKMLASAQGCGFWSGYLSFNLNICSHWSFFLPIQILVFPRCAILCSNNDFFLSFNQFGCLIFDGVVLNLDTAVVGRRYEPELETGSRILI